MSAWKHFVSNLMIPDRQEAKESLERQPDGPVLFSSKLPVNHSFEPSAGLGADLEFDKVMDEYAVIQTQNSL